MQMLANRFLRRWWGRSCDWQISGHSGVAVGSPYCFATVNKFSSDGVLAVLQACIPSYKEHFYAR